MKEQLIEFETAKLAKEKGFTLFQLKGYYSHGDRELLLWNDCERWNNNSDFICYAPTQSLLQKWLREKCNINVLYSAHQLNGSPIFYSFCLHYSYGYQSKVTKWSEPYNSYEQALEVGLQEALKLI